MGRTWQRASAGLFDTRILGVFLYPGTEDHVLAGTPLRRVRVDGRR